MSRRILCLVVAALMIFSVLPATAAFAQAGVTARLTSPSMVVPGDHDVTIEVRNGEKLLMGRTIDAVTIHLPTAATNTVLRAKPSAPGSFKTVEITDDGTSQSVTFRGGCLSPQSRQTFTIPVTVQRPQRSDLTGAWVVQVSDDNMATSTDAGPPSDGTLTSKVKALEIIPDTLRPTGPTNADNSRGVTDGSGTGGSADNAGQTITYGFSVRNHASEPLDVTGTLSANNNVDKPAPPVTKTIAGDGGTASFSTPVTLGEALRERTTVFVADAASDAAAAHAKMNPFNVQVPVDLSFTNLGPTRVRSGLASAREFTTIAHKVGGAGFDLRTTALEFGTNVANVKAPVRFGRGEGSATVAYQIPEISGDDGALVANITVVGRDDNLATVDLTKAVGEITIDNTHPTLDVPLPVLGNNGNDLDGDPLVAATDGTTVTVRGHAAGVDPDPSTLKVWLQPDVGEPIAVPVTATRGTEGLDFTGSVTGSDVSWADGATQFTVVAELADEATNVGRGESPATPIDQAAPVLDRDGAVVTTPTTIRLEWDDQTGIRGGCDPRTYSVAGSQVAEVRDSTGENCRNKRELSSDGIRVLVLSSALGADDTPAVAYSVPVDRETASVAGYEPVKDGAANYAADQRVQTVSNVMPPAPNVTNPMRRDHLTGAREGAYRDADENRYYTNVGGEDAISATVGGVKSGYKIQVLDRDENVLATYDATSKPARTPLATEWSQDILIPLGTEAGTYVRGVRLVSTVGKASVQTVLRFVIDTELPTIGQSTLSGPGEAFAYFDEKIVAGNDSKLDWYATWTLVSEGDSRTVHTQVDDVRTPDGQNLTARRVLFSGIDESAFQRLDYLLHSPSSLRYEDRAGNYMLDTLSFDSVE